MAAVARTLASKEEAASYLEGVVVILPSVDWVGAWVVVSSQEEAEEAAMSWAVAMGSGEVVTTSEAVDSKALVEEEAAMTAAMAVVRTMEEAASKVVVEILPSAAVMASCS